ncbi:hypothetical protein, partial [Rhodovulum imhoffii]
SSSSGNSSKTPGNQWHVTASPRLKAINATVPQILPLFLVIWIGKSVAGDVAEWSKALPC